MAEEVMREPLAQVAVELPEVVFRGCQYHRGVAGTARRAAAWWGAAGPGDVERKAAVLTRCIAAVYCCAADEVASLRVRVVADNPDETQDELPVFGVLMTALCGVEDEEVLVKPVEGTHIEDGVAVPVAFFQDTVGGVSYELVQLFVLHTFAEHGDARLTNLLIQVAEACVNCSARAKEVFEWSVRTYIEAYGEELLLDPLGDGSAGPAGRAAQHLATTFLWWLDTHKRAALDAAILNPQLYFSHRDYETYENVASHGAAFWGELIPACLGVPMPYTSGAAHDDGWTWAAEGLDYSSPWVLEVLDACRKGLGRGWRACLQGCEFYKLNLPPPGSALEEMKLVWEVGGMLSSVVERVKAGALSEEATRGLLRPLADFSGLLHPRLLAERFALHLLTAGTVDTTPLAHLGRPDTGPAAHADAFHPSQWVLDAADPATVRIDVDAVLTALRTAGVDLAATRAAVYPAAPLPPGAHVRRCVGIKKAAAASPPKQGTRAAARPAAPAAQKRAVAKPVESKAAVKPVARKPKKPVSMAKPASVPTTKPVSMKKPVSTTKPVTVAKPTSASRKSLATKPAGGKLSVTPTVKKPVAMKRAVPKSARAQPVGAGAKAAKQAQQGPGSLGSEPRSSGRRESLRKQQRVWGQMPGGRQQQSSRGHGAHRPTSRRQTQPARDCVAADLNGV